MRSTPCALALCLFLCGGPAWARQTSSRLLSQPAPRDPEAVNIVNQAITVGGGTQGIAAIVDYTASGTITYNGSQGPVTLNGLYPNDFRFDASLVQGVRSEVLSGGKTIVKTEDGAVHQLRVQAPLYSSSVVLPYLHLLAALSNPCFSFTYVGLTQVDGHPVHQIRVQLVMPSGIDPYGLTTAFRTRDVFFDANTFQIVMTRDILGPKQVVREIQYSDFRPTNGILVPFSITETRLSQRTVTIQLTQISFNTGLHESAFAF